MPKLDFRYLKDFISEEEFSAKAAKADRAAACASRAAAAKAAETSAPTRNPPRAHRGEYREQKAS